MRLSRLALFVAAGGFVLAACSAPPATTGPSGSGDGTPFVPDDPTEYGPGDYCADTYVLIQETTRSNFSLGSEYYRNDDYCAAYPYMRWLLDNEPLFTGEDPDDRTYLRMARIYEAFAAQVDSTEMDEQKAYLDSALMTRRAGIEAMDAAGVTYDRYLRDLQEGFFYFQNRSFYDDAEAAQFAAFRRAFEAQPDSLEDWYLTRLLELSTTAISQTDDRALFIERLAARFESPDTAEYARALARALTEPVAHTSDDAIEELLGRYREGSLEGEGVVTLFGTAVEAPERVRAAGGNPEAIRRDLLLRPEISDNVDNPTVLYALAMRAYDGDAAARGDVLFGRAVDQAESATQKADFYYGRARAEHGDRRADLDAALSVQPAHGPSLFLRASDIAAEVGQPASVRGRAAYWCVADRFRRAASTGDPGVTEAARLAADRFENAGPRLDEVFLELGWRPGDTVTSSLGSYGTCSTRVRARID